MLKILGILQAILGILSFVRDAIARAEAKAAGRQEVVTELAREDARTSHEAAEILAERRTDDDLDKRLREGSF